MLHETSVLTLQFLSIITRKCHVTLMSTDSFSWIK